VKSKKGSAAPRAGAEIDGRVCISGKRKGRGGLRKRGEAHIVTACKGRTLGWRGNTLKISTGRKKAGDAK